MQTATYTLPNDWLSYFFNGDDSGLNKEDCKAIEAIERELLMTGYSAYAIDTGEDRGFMKYHDAHHVYPYACDCTDVIFPES